MSLQRTLYLSRRLLLRLSHYRRPCTYPGDCCWGCLITEDPVPIQEIVVEFISFQSTLHLSRRLVLRLSHYRRSCTYPWMRFLLRLNHYRRPCTYPWMRFLLRLNHYRRPCTYPGDCCWGCLINEDSVPWIVVEVVSLLKTLFLEIVEYSLPIQESVVEVVWIQKTLYLSRILL